MYKVLREYENPKQMSVTPLPESVIKIGAESYQNQLTALNVTSQSNNAFIANNFLLPGRVSQINNSKSNRSRTSFLTVGDQRASNINLKETESQFDEPNNSFAFEQQENNIMY